MRVWIAYVLESYSPEELPPNIFLMWKGTITAYALKGNISDLKVIDTKAREVRTLGKTVGLGYADFKDEEDYEARIGDVCLRKLREVMPEEAKKHEEAVR